MSGVSTLAALEKGCQLDLFEKSSFLLPFQYGSDTRRIHPNFYSWPKPLSEYPYSDLPFFRWKHETASSVSKDIYRSFNRIKEEHEDSGLYNEYRNILIGKEDIERSKGSCKISFQSVDGHKAKPYDRIIIAIGFGIEKKVTLDYENINVLRDSYWRNDQYEQANLYNNDKVSYIISGVGDGALMDMFRLRIKGFTTDSIIRNFRKKSEYGRLIEKLNGIESNYYELKSKGKSTKNYLFTELVKLDSEDLLDSCKEEIKKRLRSDTMVVIHHYRLQFEEIFNLEKASFFNNLLMFLLFQLNAIFYHKKKIELEYDLPEKFILTEKEIQTNEKNRIKNQENITSLVNDINKKQPLYKKVKILLRHGSDKIAPLKDFGLDPKLIDQFKEIQKDSTNNHLYPIWPINYYEEKFGFVEPELLTLANTFVSGVSGYVKHRFKEVDNIDFRICMHRAIKRSGKEFYQQISQYFGSNDSFKSEEKQVGRIFPIEHGLVGYSMTTGRSLRLSAEKGEFDAWKLLMMNVDERKTVGNKKLGDPKDKLKSLFTCPIFTKIEDKLYPIFCFYMDSSSFSFKEEFDKNIEVTELIYSMCAEFTSQLENMIVKKRLFNVHILKDYISAVDTNHPKLPMNRRIENASNFEAIPKYEEIKSSLMFNEITPNYITLNYRYES